MTTADAEESTRFNCRFIHDGPRIYHRQQSASKGPYLDSRHRQQVTNSSRYIEAQIKNRMELMRLEERRETLDRQQRDATTIIDRSKQRFVEEMANVGKTTSDSTATVPRTHSHQRQTAAASRTTVPRHKLNSYEMDDITPALVALQLDERDAKRSQRRGFRPNTTTGCVNSARTDTRPRFTASTNVAYRRHTILPDPFRLTTMSNSRKMAAMPRRACHSVAGRSTIERQDIGIKRTPTFTSTCRANSTMPSEMTSATDSSAVATKNQENAETERSSANADGIAADHRRKSSSRWKKDLKREAPPALFGYRPSLNWRGVLSQAERRRRLAALQTRQMAPSAADSP